MSKETTKSGKIFIIAAASGTGKTSLVTQLLKELPQLQFSVSHTTRAPRFHETDGQHYHFVDKLTFMDMQQKDDFIESAFVHGNYYGTSKKSIQKQIDTGNHVLLEIDWQGARQIKKRCPSVVSIFILPPNFKELMHRLHKRGQDTEEVIQERLKMANNEMAHFDEFDHWLVNDDFDRTFHTLKNMIQET